RAQVGDEALRAVPVPDIDGRMDLQEEAPGVAHELGPELLRDVPEPDLARREVVLQPLEALHEVAVELVLQNGEGRLAHLDVRLSYLADQRSCVVVGDPEL